MIGRNNAIIIGLALVTSTWLLLRQSNLQTSADLQLAVATESFVFDAAGGGSGDPSAADAEAALCRGLLMTWECMAVPECLAHHTVAEILRWTPQRARPSCKALFQHWPCTATDSCADASSLGKLRPGDIVVRSQLQLNQEAPPYVPPAQRFVTPFPPPFTCVAAAGATITIHPITMGAVREMFLGEKRRRAFHRITDFSELYPKKRQQSARDPILKPFHINDEVFALLNMATSRFGITTKRWGWDCLRHYEYSAYGVLPYFVDLPVAPNRSVASLPRNLLLPILSMPGVAHNGALRSLRDGYGIEVPGGTMHPLPCFYQKPFFYDGGAHVACNATGSVDHAQLNVAEYERVSAEYYAYAERYLNTGSIAASLLQRAGAESARHVLLVLLQPYVEFNQISLHHGLVDLGLHVTAYPRIEGHYKRHATQVPNIDALERLREKHLRFHGNGYMWGMRVFDDDSHPSQEDVMRMIEEKAFDVVIFAGYNSGRPESVPFFRQVSMSYSSANIIFVQTTDAPYPHGVERDWSSATAYGHFFMREVQDVYTECPNPVVAPAVAKAWLRSRSPYELTTVAASPADCSKQLPEYMVHHDDSVVLLDGYHWGEIYIKGALSSIRKHTNATIVLLCPHNESYLSVTVEHAASFEKYQPFAAVLFHNASVHKDQFLLYAAREFLLLPSSRRFSRVVVSSSLEVFWVKDLFRFVGPDVYVATMGAHRDFGEHVLGDCGLSLAPSASLPAGHAPAKLAHFTHQTLAGDRKQLLLLLSLIEAIGGFSVCSNEAALNGVMHAIDIKSALGDVLSVVAWSSETGPVIFHDATSCAKTTRAETLCGNEGNAAVLLNMCPKLLE